MATHTPHVRTKKPLRGRTSHLERRLRGLPKLRRSTAPAAAHAVDTRLVRRGPTSGKLARESSDVPFRIATAGVILAAAVLGVAMGLAQPSWLLAAALVGGGALIASIVALAMPRLVDGSTFTRGGQMRSMP